MSHVRSDEPVAEIGRRPRVRSWAIALITLALMTAAMHAERDVLDKAHITLVYLLVVLASSAAGGRTLGLTVATLAFFCFDFFFLAPYSTLIVANPLDWLVLVTFLVTSGVAAQLLYRANATAEEATQRAIEVDRLASLGAETLNAADAGEALRAIADVIRTSVNADVCEIYVRRVDARTVLAAESRRDAAGGESNTAHAHSARAEVRPPVGGPTRASLIDWIVERGTSAVELDDGTIRVAQELPVPNDERSVGAPERRDTIMALRAITRFAHPSFRTRWRRVLSIRDESQGKEKALQEPAARGLVLPLQVRAHTVGVLRVVAAHELVLTPEQARLLSALAYYAALGAERARLVATAERAEAERRVEALRSALLTAVSHDFRTPLTTIKGTANEILRGGDPARAAVIEAEADRMDSLVGDLLDLSRIHAGAVGPALEVNTLDDLLGAALRGASGPLRGRRVEIDAPTTELLLAVFDFTQTLRIVVNLLDNAAKYSPSGSAVDVRVRRIGERVTIDVMDRGPGVPPSEQERIFDPFYRPPGVSPDVRGHGLGLSIARGLAEAQGALVHYAPRQGGGSVFTLDLPAARESAIE